VSVFADSSALVKLYADEPGHEPVRRQPVLVVSQLARVEVPAAIWRKTRIGELSTGHARILTDAFEADYFGTAEQEARFAVVRITARILDDAASMLATRGLRAHDAVQLASGCAARTADPEIAVFAAFDDTLRIAALAEGFALLPEEEPAADV
jgi:predicted nucleic acid-binding protein